MTQLGQKNSGAGDRLRAALGTRKGNWLAAETGIATSLISEYMKGMIPGADKAVRIAEVLGISVHWWVTGEHQPATPSDGRPDLAERRQVVRTIDGFTSIPQIDVQASAGAGRVALEDGDEPAPLLMLRDDLIRRLGLTPGLIHALVVRGDSMAPTIQDGDMILVDRAFAKTRLDGIYVLAIGGAVKVKRLQALRDGSLVLKSDNPVYEDEIIAPTDLDDVIVEGPVRWVGRTM